MTIRTDKGEILKLTSAPEYSQFWNRYYAAGFRFIKSRQAFSKTALVHNFASFTPVEG